MLPVLQSATTRKDSFTGSLCIGNRLGYAFYAPASRPPTRKRKSRHERPAILRLGLHARRPPRKVEAIDEERREVSVRDGSSTRFVAYSLLEDARVPSNDCPTLRGG